LTFQTKKKIANLDWPLHQFDVKNAFLHGDLEKEGCMKIPLGLENSSSVGKVCKLKKTLYGLKQSPSAWLEQFSLARHRFGYKLSSAYHILFIKDSNQRNVIALIVYVDDIFVTRNDDGEIQNLKHFVANESKIKNLCSLKYFHSIEVARSKHGIFISQQKHILVFFDKSEECIKKKRRGAQPLVHRGYTKGLRGEKREEI
jgi:hypothetical protein